VSGSYPGEAQAEKLGWFPPELLITDRQAKRMRKLGASEKVSDRIVAAGSPSTPLFILTFLASDTRAAGAGLGGEESVRAQGDHPVPDRATLTRPLRRMPSSG
jgi:hypothetical protein